MHATPADPLFTYVPYDAPLDTWQAMTEAARRPSLLVLGHTHEQFVRTVDGTTIVNPGSVGLPKDGDAKAAYAVIEDGEVTLRRTAYDIREAARRINALPLSANDRRRLTTLIYTATLPS